MGGFTSLATIYNVNSLESDTVLYNKPGIFSHGFIDGEYFKDVPMSYRFKSLGSHQVILYLKDIEIIPDAAFPVFVIGTPKFQDWVAISIKS